MTAGPRSSSSSGHKRTRNSNWVHAVVRLHHAQGRLEDILFSEYVRVRKMVHLPKIGPFIKP